MAQLRMWGKQSTTTALCQIGLTAWLPLQYRTRKNYMNKDFLGPRIADKLCFVILMTW